MAAFLIVDIKVNDRSKFKEYAKAVQITVEAFGGRYLCKLGVPKTLEGEWDASKIVVVEFATTKQAEAWWDSEEYRPLKTLRREVSTTKVLLVDDN